MLERRSRSARGDTGLAVFFLVTIVLLLLVLALLIRGRRSEPTDGQRDRAAATDAGGTAPLVDGRRELAAGERPPEADWRASVGDRPPEAATESDPAGSRAARTDRVDAVTEGAARDVPPPSRAEPSNQERQRQNAERMLGVLVRSVATFRDIVGRNPRDLPELTRPIPGHVEGVLGAAGVPADPWGRPYVYGGRVGSTGPVWIRSLGADGREGGAGHDADLVATFDD